jgi:hypothetical protein
VPYRNQTVIESARHTRKCQTGTDRKQIKDKHKPVVPDSARQDLCTVKNLQVALDRADSNQAMPGLRSDRH